MEKTGGLLGPLWKASMAASMSAVAQRSCRAPICVYRAPMLNNTLPFSKARARCDDGTPVRESYLRDQCTHLMTYNDFFSKCTWKQIKMLWLKTKRNESTPETEITLRKNPDRQKSEVTDWCRSFQIILTCNQKLYVWLCNKSKP